MEHLYFNSHVGCLSKNVESIAILIRNNISNSYATGALTVAKVKQPQSDHLSHEKHQCSLNNTINKLVTIPKARPALLV